MEQEPGRVITSHESLFTCGFSRRKQWDGTRSVSTGERYDFCCRDEQRDRDIRKGRLDKRNGATRIEKLGKRRVTRRKQQEEREKQECKGRKKEKERKKGPHRTRRH